MKVLLDENFPLAMQSEDRRRGYGAPSSRSAGVAHTEIDAPVAIRRSGNTRRRGTDQRNRHEPRHHGSKDDLKIRAGHVKLVNDWLIWSSAMAATVSAFEAKTRFGELMERVNRGEEIVITRHDKPVARLVPEGAQRLEDVRRAVRGLRELQHRIARRRKGRVSLSTREVRSAIEEGRR